MKKTVVSENEFDPAKVFIELGKLASKTLQKFIECYEVSSIKEEKENELLREALWAHLVFFEGFLGSTENDQKTQFYNQLLKLVLLTEQLFSKKEQTIKEVVNEHFEIRKYYNEDMYSDEVEGYIHLISGNSERTLPVIKIPALLVVRLAKLMNINLYKNNKLSDKTYDTLSVIIDVFNDAYIQKWERSKLYL